MLDPAETNSEAGNSNASVRLTESVVVLDKSYDMNGKGILSDKANIYVSPALTGILRHTTRVNLLLSAAVCLTSGKTR